MLAAAGGASGQLQKALEGRSTQVMDQAVAVSALLLPRRIEPTEFADELNMERERRRSNEDFQAVGILGFSYRQEKESDCGGRAQRKRMFVGYPWGNLKGAGHTGAESKEKFRLEMWSNTFSAQMVPKILEIRHGW